MDIFNKCFDYSTVKEAKASGVYPYFIPLDENEGTEVIFNGRHIIMCGSNNYLGLTTHPKVRQAAIDALNRYGTSCTGSRFLNGNLTLHETLEEEIADGNFREDLYYRLNVVSLELPDLAGRREDIPLLAQHFLQELVVRSGKKVSGFAPEAMELLLSAAWPGNVRQLHNVVEQAVALSTSPVIPCG